MLKRLGIEPRPFAPKANTLPIKLHLEKAKMPEAGIEPADFPFQGNALTD
jgi:hypothetical protein